MSQENDDTSGDEEADDAFGQQLLEHYENDPDPDKGRVYTPDDCENELG